MAIRGASLIETSKYYSKFDEAETDAEKTTFLIGAIDVAVRSFIQDQSNQWTQTEEGMRMTTRGSWRNFEIVRFGLKGIQNYKDEKGNDIPFTTSRRAFNGKMYDVVSDEFIATLDGRIIGELADEITEINTNTEAMRKKICDAVTAIRLYPHFDCKLCIENKKQAERGCEKDAPFAYWTDIDGEYRTRCPRRPIFEDLHWFNVIISAYNAYKAGFLPHPGGMMDQPALFPFVMATIDDAINSCDKAIQEKQAQSRGEGTSVLVERPNVSGAGTKVVDSGKI